MAYLFYHRLLHTSVLKSGKSRRYRIRYYFTQTINCKQRRNLEFVQDSSNKYVVRIKPRVVKREVIEEQTNHSQQCNERHIFVENESTKMDFLVPVVSQVVVNSFEALWLVSTQLLNYLSKNEVNHQRFQKKLVTLIVAIWIVLRVIAVIPLLPEALELTGLVTSVIVFYRYQTDRGVQEQVAFCIERVKTLLQQYFHH
ncbi:uncharacterized protein Gasu_60830 [Galdieria sulphuraria]|uniref:Uncharacterized protein n=1 Tax=Galdieria sulphuraria TaxID=130081 RepID=M2XS87_GALSU|nr:uncharacterized protein Gasu_60830 [Galdieria sulphuraria]EME26279.1 hypothetical protein Gasu_60830 [Galdieria sulphuraria]|eukprot:XP_005702799.1 hypothetical protein Gasu_60830 [Galdieria sulphuraria]